MSDIRSVMVVAGGTWHAPHLASQLYRHNILECVATSTPPFRFVRRVYLPRNRLRWLAGAGLRGPALGQFMPPLSHLGLDPLRFAEAVDSVSTKLVRRHEPDVVFLFARFGLLTMRNRGGNKAPVCILERASVHVLEQIEIMAQEYRDLGLPFARPDGRLVERELKEYQLADYISVPSSYAADTFVARGTGPQRIITVPFGVDLERFRLPSKVLTVHRRCRILAVGNLGIGKGTHHLLRAVAALKSMQCRVVLVGTLDAYVTELVRRLGLHESVEVVGRVDQGRLARYYWSADMFVHPSLHEGMSMSVLEALACGLPVIVSDRSGYMGTIIDGKNGLVVPAGDVAALADAIRMLWEDRDMCEHICQAGQRTAANHSWDKYGDQMVRLLNGLGTSA